MTDWKTADESERYLMLMRPATAPLGCKDFEGLRDQGLRPVATSLEGGLHVVMCEKVKTE